MFRYCLKRLISLFVTLFFLATAIFFLLRFIPGSPFAQERPLPPQIEAQLMEKYNLKGSLLEQYGNYLGNFAKGEFGESMQKIGVGVDDIIKQSFPTSAKVGGLAVLLIIILGIPMGIAAGMNKNKWPDYAVSCISTLGITIPSFVIGTFLMYILGERLGIIPVGGLSGWRSYIGPVIALGGFSIAFVARLMRSSFLDVIGQDYIRTARANGLSRSSIIFKHALKNALIPVITYIGPTVASILTGSFVTEKIFAINGMGKYFVESITNRDYMVVMGTTLFFATFYVTMVFLTDIAYALIDPRIKLSE